ncbi:DELLA protein GAI1-like [Rutidosis leptorrhynchoides]|uniref:DELLA protein GAI1-like n=1 Tax=Rutidosis leptorrhynchoides TaxID=125765 RepID=UPI003A98E7D9
MFPSKKVDHGKHADDEHSSDFLGPNCSDNGSRLDFDNLYVDFSSALYRGIIKCTKDSSCDNVSSKVDDETVHVSSCNIKTVKVKDKTLSTNARIELASQLFIEYYSSKIDEIADLAHPFAVFASGQSYDEAKDIELLITLLASVEKTSQLQFDSASQLIETCNNMSSDEGNPVERLVYYFSAAICEKINKETGKVSCNVSEIKEMIDLHEASMSVDKCVLSFHQNVPLLGICLYGAVYSIIEKIKGSRQVHLIDLDIRCGLKYKVMLQNLANQEWDLDLFKITAVCTRAESKIKDTGTSLAEFAKSMNIPFSYKVVMVADILDFNTKLLELNEDEKVAVCAPFFFSTLISKPNSLEYLMSVIRKINPCITVMIEIEANHTTPTFENRFTEAMFFYGALFDCMSYCMADDDRYRKVCESIYFGQSIRNIVAADGDERTVRHIGVDVWRLFFARFGMVEIEVSDESVSEAKSLITSSDCGNACSIRVDGGCLLIDWKDIPVFSVSSWKSV